MTLPCEGLTVLDFCNGYPGTLATMILADFGAEVIKVQPPGRREPTAAAWSLMWDRGKKSVVLDLVDPADQAIAQAMAARADVLVESFRPGVAERLGIGYSQLSEANPALVYCSITGFGRSGPYKDYKGYEAIVSAKVGRMMDFSGQVDRPGPVFSAVPVASFGALNGALQGILGALYVRSRTGQGQQVEASLINGITPYDWGSLFWQAASNAGELEAHQDPTRRAQTSVGYMVACTKDGVWLQFAHNGPPKLFRAFVSAIGLDSLWDDPRFAKAPSVATADRDELVHLLSQRIRERTWQQWQDIFDQVPDIAVQRYLSTQEAMDHPQMRHNGSIVKVDDPRVGVMEQIGPLVEMAATPAKIGAPAPDPGAHTSEIVRGLDAPEQSDRVLLGSDAALPAHPLEGVTVLEFAGWYAAPFGTAMVADLGARVIKIEPLEGDPFRPMGTPKTTVGKEDIALDLRTEEGRKIAHELVARADVVMENFRPGVPQRLGIDYETLKEINPDLIYLYAGLYGDSGPYSARPGFHPTAGAMSGGALYQAGQSLPPADSADLTLDEVVDLSAKLMRANEGNPDASAALVVGTAVVLGIVARQRTGLGQYMMTTMINSNCYAVSDDFMRYADKLPRQEVDAQTRGLGPLYQLYETGEGWVFLAAPTGREWRDLVVGLGREDLSSDPRFATPEARQQHAAALADELDTAFRQRGADEWEALLTGLDVACVRADNGGNGATLSLDPVMLETGVMVEVDDPQIGRYRRQGPGVQLSRTPNIARPGTLLGQHTRSILSELGYSESQIDDLKARGIVGFPQ